MTFPPKMLARKARQLQCLRRTATRPTSGVIAIADHMQGEPHTKQEDIDDHEGYRQ
jgi:hypothetical protein